jgi:predicted permease
MWFRTPSADRRLDAELRDHFDRLVGDYLAQGLDLGEARRRARLEFGGIGQLKEDCRDVQGRWLEDFARDLRYAARTLRRSPGFLAVSVLSLALGIGANSAVFSLINAVMLRPLPVEDPGRIVHITRLADNGRPIDVSYPLFQHFQDNMKSLSALAIEMESNPVIIIDGAEELVPAELVTGDHFRLLGLEPAAGRLLEPGDDASWPAVPAAVISYRYWERRFGRNPEVVGKTFNLYFANRAFTIVGVTPQRYYGTRPGRDPDLTLPVTMLVGEAQRREPTFNAFEMLGRLAPGATLAQANAELQVQWRAFQQSVAPALAAADRAQFLARRAIVLPGAHGLDRLRDDYSAALFVLMGIVGLVLLLACANLSGLLLARAAAREREISIRLAIGAGSGRLFRQFLTESLALAALGGSAGLLLARWFSATLVAMLTRNEPLQLSTAPDARVLAFTTAISLAACVLAGLAPGWHALHANLNPGLKQARMGGHPRLGKSLVVVQLAISMMLVVGAALFVATLARLHHVDRGIRTDSILTFRVRTNERYSPERRWTALGPMLDRLNATPGVASATVADMIPLSGGLWDRRVQVEGYHVRPDQTDNVAFNAVGPKYFATLGTPRLAGREFEPRDNVAAPPVAIVNQSFARRFFAGRSPLGRRVTSLNIPYEIVGVAGDARYQDLRQDILPTMYIPLLQRSGDSPSNYTFLVRVAAGDPMRLAPSLPQLVREVDAGLRIRAIQAYSEVVDGTIVTERILAALGGFFGLLALIVACLGIFGVTAFQVARRSGEIGLRIALGATRGGIVGLVLREVAALVVPGCLIGAAGALALTGLTRKMLYGVSPADPAVFVTAAVILAGAALAAGWLPARRASRVDPVIALRHE